MKKVFSLCIVITIVFLLTACSSAVKIKEDSVGIAKFKYEDVNIETELSSEHLKELTNMFNNKELYFDSPSCGFSENVSVKIDNQTFCIANDMCDIIYIRESNKIFYIGDTDNERLRDILEQYGFSFPCV